MVVPILLVCVLQEKFTKYKEMFEEVKQQRLEERRNQRRVKRKQEHLIALKEKKEEEARLAKEKAEQEENERLERQMKIQKEKEREIEERQRRKEEEMRHVRETDERVDTWRKGDRDQKANGWHNEDISAEDKKSPRMDQQYGPPKGHDDDGYYDDRGPPRRDDGGWRGRDEGGRWPGRDDCHGYRDECRDNDDNWCCDNRSRDLSPSFRRRDAVSLLQCGSVLVYDCVAVVSLREEEVCTASWEVSRGT